MMGFGTLGNGAGGYPSSSTSNLSALAPPFTVDRVNPRPNLNPFSHYSDSTYAVEPFNPHAWQYAHPSAPEPDIVIDSPGINTGPTSDDYRFPATMSVNPSSTQWSVLNSGTQTTSSAFAYGGEVKPYYSPHVPPLVGEDSLLIEDEGSRYTSGLSVTSQHDYTHSLFDLEYGPQSAECWGFDDGKRVKRSDMDGNFSSEKANFGGSGSFINQIYQGGHVNGKSNKSKEDYGVLYQSLSQVSDRGNHTRSPSTELLEDKSSLEQNVSFAAYNTDRLVTPSSSPYPEFYPPLMASEIPKNFPNYEKCVRPVDTPFPGRASVVRASPSVVIRPPPATNGNLRQSVASRKPASSENLGGVHGVNFGYNNPSKIKDFSFQSSSKIRVEPFDANLFNLSKQGNGLISPTLVKELPKDTSDRKVKARFGYQLPDINVSRNFSNPSDVPGVDSSEDSSEFVVDSPCWKGAPSSQFSTFDVEAGNSKINFDEHFKFGHEEHKNVNMGKEHESARNGSTKEQSSLDGAKEAVWISPATNKGIELYDCPNFWKEHECARNGVALSARRTPDAICSTKQQTNKGVELYDDPKMQNNACSLMNNLLSALDMKVSDTKSLVGEEGMTVNDVSDGAAVAVHAAEKVLDSPASQEDAAEHIVKTDPKLDVTAMIKTIHNLSELIRFNLSSDACSLEENNLETLKDVISNLDYCLSKKVVQASNNPEPNCEILGESRIAGTTLGDPRTESEAAGSKLKFDYLQIHETERNFPGKKDEKPAIFSLLGDDLDITVNDDMTKAIKTVLDENFDLSEEMHSRALLFKSLWLEAEAKLCSISYKARFNRMKIHMEEIKHKAPQGNEHIAEITSQVSASADPITIPELAHDGPSLGPTLPYVSVASTSSQSDDVEASVLARFNILKSREGNINKEEEQKPEMVADDDSGSLMARQRLLKSREENSKSIEEEPPQMIDGDVGSIMARLSILKLRDNTKMEEEKEKQPNTIDCDFAGEKYLRSCIRGQIEDDTLVVAQTPHQTQGNFVSYSDVSGYESLNGYHLSVANDPIIRSFKGSMMIDENKSGSHDSSSSDWEHVLKEDFPWKNL